MIDLSKLSSERLRYYRSKLTKTNSVPCRFLYNGQAMDISTGDLCSKGSNVIYHPVYWDFDKPTAKELATELGVKVVFSE